jgi:hypothetical protein
MHLPVSDRNEGCEQWLAVAALLVDQPQDDALVVAVKAG